MDIEKVGAYLSELRRQHGFTQEELWEKLGVTNKTISRWETGKYLPPVDALEGLSTLYGITINEILSGSRLPCEQYQEAAEENIKSALRVSAFSLKEKMEFFKKKWKKEHVFEMILGMLVILAIIIAGSILKNGLLILGTILGIVWSGFKHNQMMAYVERKAFDENQD